MSLRKVLTTLLVMASLVLPQNKILAQQSFALGADVSWITEMEAANRKFYSADGQEMECMSLLQSLGMNTIRLRVWVNPQGGWNGINDLLIKAKRANQLGMRLMINFHYSDFWADPGKQNKPAAWTALTFTQLQKAVYDHTFEVLDSLKKYDIYPEWVQIGNETGNGMLWEDGRASVNMANYAKLHNAGYDAAKAVFPLTKVMIHLHNGYDNGMYRWMFDGLKNNGARWDIIGMSLYPSWSPDNWQTTNQKCLANMNDMVNRYDTEVMIVETGMSWDAPQEAFAFLTDLIAKTKAVNKNRGKGVLYWEPQSYKQWKGYTLGAFDDQGRPTQALNAFKIAAENQTPSEDHITMHYNPTVKEVRFSELIDSLQVFSIKGNLEIKRKNVTSFATNLLAPGMYLVRMSTTETETVKKLVLY